jgi:acyl-CoA synthetase (AMP-forming)/AMP-acid ligase II
VNGAKVEWHLATYWEAISDLLPDKIAVAAGPRQLSWSEYDGLAAQISKALAAHGVEPGARVGLYLYNCPEYLILQYGSFKAGAVPINVNYRYVDEELLYLLNNSRAEVLAFHSSLGDRVERIRSQLRGLRLLIEVDDGVTGSVSGAVSYEMLVSAFDPAARGVRSAKEIYFFYTGGTTGMPKAVMYRHGDAASAWASVTAQALGRRVPSSVGEAARLALYATEVGESPATVVACPFMHATGMWLGVYATHALGGSVRSMAGRSFDARELWQTVSEYRATQVVLVGDPFARPMLEVLDEAEGTGSVFDLESLRSIMSSGAMWSAEVKDGLLRHLDVVLEDSFGSTEVAMGRHRASRVDPPCTGRFLANPGVRVLTEDGRDVVPGSGEIGLVHGPALMVGYFDDSTKTDQTIRVIGRQRYVASGDWARVEADGSLRLVGRGSGCINTGGEKVFPEEVEEVLKRHKAVEDCLTVGVPDLRLGEQVAAVVQLASGTSVTPAELVAWVKDRLASFKTPRQLLLVERVQRAPNGKADYRWARSLFRSDSAGDAKAE